GIVFIEQERLLAHGEQVGSEAKLEFPQQLLKCELSDTDVGLCQFYFGLALSTQYDELLQLKRFLTGSSNVKGSFIDGVVGIDISNQYRIWVCLRLNDQCFLRLDVHRGDQQVQIVLQKQTVGLTQGYFQGIRTIHI